MSLSLPEISGRSLLKEVESDVRSLPYLIFLFMKKKTDDSTIR
jgi:hypothetical protein